MCTKLTLSHSEIFPLEAELVCKYFTGLRDLRFGDLQSASPCQEASRGDMSEYEREGGYDISYDNGFMNITLDDGFLVKYTGSFAASEAGSIIKNSEDYLEPTPGDMLHDISYKKYVLSNYISRIWGSDRLRQALLLCSEKEYTGGVRLDPELHRLYVMFLFIHELCNKENKDRPQVRGRTFKLYWIFINDLYAYFTRKAINDAEAADIAIAAAAFAVNIPVFREA